MIILVVNWKQRLEFDSAGNAEDNGQQQAMGMDETPVGFLRWIGKLCHGLFNL
jgi:hypothetical protein